MATSQQKLTIRLSKWGQIKLYILGKWWNLINHEPSDAKVDALIDKHVQFIRPQAKD